ALSIRDAINDMNAAGSELDLQLRVAVNTGEAIVAMGASPSEGEGMVAGDVVNTASRLQTAAPVNSILVGEGTHRATHTVIEYEEIEALTLKGKDSPVRAWVATRASLAPGIRATADVPLVGRDRELATLF